MAETWRDRVRAKMRSEGITQEDLKSVFEVSTRGAVGHYLSGRRDPTIEQMVALARRLRMSLDEVLLGSPASQSARPPDETIDKAIDLLQMLGAAMPKDGRFHPLRWRTISDVAAVLSKREYRDQREMMSDILAVLQG